MFFQRYIRWRHSRGFGVHSPYAYRFVTDVLRPGDYAYYAYEKAETLLKDEEIRQYKFFNRIKFLIRLANFLKTERVISCPPHCRLTDISSEALSLPCLSPTSKIKFKAGDFLIIVNNDKDSLPMVRNAIEAEIPVYAVNPTAEIRKIMETPLGKGLLLKGKKSILLIPRKDMEYVRYILNLP